MSWRFSYEKSLLLVVDMQERLMQSVANSDYVVNQAMALIRVARMMHMQVIVTEQMPEKLGATIAPLHSLLSDLPPRPKSSFSAMDALAWRIPNDIILVGVETHICIRQTAFDFLGQDKRVAVLADAVSSINEYDHHMALEEMRRGGVRITTMQALVMEMVGNANAPGFREILGVLKEHASHSEAS